jgi:hypothetical protein
VVVLLQFYIPAVPNHILMCAVACDSIAGSAKILG